MKKAITAVLSAGMAVSLCACSASGKYKAGTYTGEAKGHSSTVKATVEFSADAIKNVTLDLSGETASIGQAAGDQLKKNIMNKQSGDIDSVTGATETSGAVSRAVKDAVNQALASKDAAAKQAVKDGVYTESAASFGFTGDMVADVTFKDGKISDVSIKSETDSSTGQWFGKAKEKLIPRIIDAQSIGIDSITGATTSSGAIKSIVAKAIDAAGGKSDEWYTPSQKSTEVKKLDGYDVIVVGLGGSGILSYCSAADSGAKVFGMDAAAGLGGNSSSVYGPMALNSKNLAAKYNNGQDYINEDEVYSKWIEYTGDEKADVIKKAVYESGSALDYYMDKFAFSFDGMKSGMLGSFVYPQWNKEWTVYTADQNNSKWYILGPDHTFQFQIALDKAKKINDKNDYQLELRATDLLTDKDGNITGVKAVSYDGTTYEISGKSVILATGGYLGNQDMLKDNYGSTVHALGDTVNDGTGIQMGEKVGGTTYGMKTLPMIHISQVPNIIRTNELTPDQKAILSALALTTDVPEVTENGEKWGDSDASGTSTETGLTVGIAYAPGFHYYNVYSEDSMNAIKQKGLSETQSKAIVNFVGNGGKLPAAETPVSDLDTILEVGQKYKNIFKGTVKQLSSDLNMDADKLAASLGVAVDSDKVFYLSECAGYSYGTVGGLNIDANMNVLKDDGTPIANLFAVGQDSEGSTNKDGAAYTPWGGQAQSWTFVSGKIAGANAASLK